MHQIRLRRPWSRTDARDGTPQRVDVPDVDPLQHAETGHQPSGELRYERAFNQPTGLTAQSKIWLEVTSLAGDEVLVQLNGQQLLKCPAEQLEFPLRFSIGDSIQLSNRLMISLEGRRCCLDGEVRLMIED